MIKILTLALLFIPAARPEVATKYKDLLVEKHNELRKKQHGSNMNKLVMIYDFLFADLANNEINEIYAFSKYII